MRLLQSLCVSFLSKGVLKLEPGPWGPVVYGFQGCALRAGPGHSYLRGLSPDPCLISECKEFFCFCFVSFLFLEAVCSI